MCACMRACGLGACVVELLPALWRTSTLISIVAAPTVQSPLFPTSTPASVVCFSCVILFVLGFFVVILALSLGWDMIVLSTFTFSLFEAASYTADQVVLTPKSLSTNTFHGLGLQELAFGTTSSFDVSVWKQDFIINVLWWSVTNVWGEWAALGSYLSYCLYYGFLGLKSGDQISVIRPAPAGLPHSLLWFCVCF